ncbi:MAG: hypothetical protein ACREAM_02920, partial [Blastocatellia bacterium]
DAVALKWKLAAVVNVVEFHGRLVVKRPTSFEQGFCKVVRKELKPNTYNLQPIDISLTDFAKTLPPSSAWPSS